MKYVYVDYHFIFVCEDRPDKIVDSFSQPRLDDHRLLWVIIIFHLP